MNKVTKMFKGHNLTIINEKGGEPKFLLNDVCAVLGLAPRTVRQRLDDDVCSTYPIKDSLGRVQKATFVNEDGLYDVILDSRKPEARKFRKWITSEVLPSIRKTGGYQVDTTQLSPELQIMNNMVQALAKQELETNKVKQGLEQANREINNVRNIFTINTKNWRKKANDLIIKMASKRNDLDAYRDVRNESYERLEDRARCNLNIRLDNKHERMRKEGRSKSAIKRVNKMDVIADDDRLIEIYLTVVKEMAIKYGVEKEVQHVP